MKINVNALKQQLNLKGDIEVLVKVNDNSEPVRLPLSQILSLIPEDYIPLAGTNTGSPVTGDIELDVYNVGSIRFIGVKIDDNPYPVFSMIDGGNISLFSEVYDTSTSATIMLSSFTKREDGFELLKNSSETFTSVPFKGFYSDDYYGANYDDNTYVQKKYVDDKVIPTFLELDNGEIINVESGNVQIITTGVGTGISSVDLLPTIAIGETITITDLASTAAANNIQIDAGAGYTILNGAGSTPTQDITIDTNGTSITIRKMTTTQYAVIAKA